VEIEQGIPTLDLADDLQQVGASDFVDRALPQKGQDILVEGA
jgi:hypothetical protein